MKTILSLSVFFCAIALPVFGQLTDTDLNKIRLIIQEEIKKEIEPIKADIVTLKTDVAWIKGKLEGIDKQVTHGTNVTYGLIALIVAAVAIPQFLIARRSKQDRALERQVEMLTQEIEKLKQQRIVNP
ncbi:hypothetical protein C6501_17045 [Candidatus Poribacteria bacterium]|nr:MAG: hypothetical protein C6501_17045 [Candidatus Poribacteria bacterium]